MRHLRARARYSSTTTVDNDVDVKSESMEKEPLTRVM